MNAIKKIKLLESIRQGQIGGGESHLLSLVEHLDRSKFDVVVLSFTEGPMIERLNKAGVPTHVIPTLKPFDVSTWGRVKRLMREEGIDLLHAHGTRACSNTLWAARSLGIPVVYTIHGWSFHDDQNPLVRGLRVMGEKYLTGRSDLNISVSASNRESGRARLPGFESVVINNGIDQRRFAGGGSGGAIREELGIPASAVVVVFIARFTAHKQPLTLIRAFSAAMKLEPSLYLLMVGEGDEQREGEELAGTLGLGTRVIFQPFRQDVPELLAASDIYVLPSLWEGLPIGLLEAMAMGRAVIATGVDGTREIVAHRENGLLVTPGSVSELAEALVELAQSADEREKFGKMARATVSERFDAGQMTKEIEQAYERLLT